MQSTFLDLIESTSSVEDSLAKTYLWLDNVRGWLANGAACSGRQSSASEYWNLVGYLSRMSLDFSVLNLAETSLKSSQRWMNSGTAWRGGCLTLRTSESPNVAVVCLLSDILENHAPPKYFLSRKACQGILRRAKKRGKTLPEQLQQALTHIATIGKPKPSQQSQPYKQAEQKPADPQEWEVNPTSSLQVRRLTPTECEILQGFPPGWTLKEGPSLIAHDTKH